MKRSLKTTAIAATALAAFALTACSGGESGESEALDPNADLSQQTLTVTTWDAYYPEDLAEKFEAETGVKVNIVHHTTNEDAVAKITGSADSGIDVAFVSGSYALALIEQGLLEPLDKSFIPNESNLYPEASTLAYDEGNTFSMPYTWGTTGLCYRSDLLSEEPTSWMDLLDPSADAVGKTTMLSTERWMMLPAQKALGYSVNTTDPAELEKVKELLISAKPKLLGYDDTTFYEKVLSGEAVLTEAWDGWCNIAIGENEDVKYVVPEEGSDLVVDTMTVLKTSKNKEAAMTFINYILQPEVQQWVAENILYAVPNEPAMDALSDEFKAQYPNMSMTHEEYGKNEATVDLGESAPEYTAIVSEVKSS